MACAICETRRPRRFCPGVRGDICSICCGTGREVTVSCPLDCPYLQEAHTHERPAPLDPATVPNQDVRITEEFLQDNESLIMLVASSLLTAISQAAGAVDGDVKEALDALARTYRTLQSGVYYETRPANPIAGNIWAFVQDSIQRVRDAEREQGLSRIRDAGVLGVLVFWERMAYDYDNGRPRGRAFISFLYRTSGAAQAEGGPLPQPSSSLIVP